MLAYILTCNLNSRILLIRKFFLIIIGGRIMWQRNCYQQKQQERHEEHHYVQSISSSQPLKPKPVFYCPGCGRQYSWRQSMLLHYKNACGKEPQFACPHCPYRAKQKGNLDKHIEIKHSSRTVMSI